MGDVEDPQLYAAQPIWEWQQTEQGQWVMENSIEPPVFTINPDLNSLGYRVVITGKLNPEAETYFTLKYR
jgi:hypothetical protein